MMNLSIIIFRILSKTFSDYITLLLLYLTYCSDNFIVSSKINVLQRFLAKYCKKRIYIFKGDFN